MGRYPRNLGSLTNRFKNNFNPSRSNSSSSSN
jgi:hypothetical protein